MERAKNTPPRSRRHGASPRVGYTIGGVVVVGAASALTIATVLSSPQLDTVPVRSAADDAGSQAVDQAALASRSPRTTLPPAPPRRGVVIQVDFPTPVLRPQPAPQPPPTQVAGTQYARRQQVAAPQAPRSARPAAAPTPAPSRCGTGTAAASLVTQTAPTTGTATTDYTTTLTATVGNRVTNAIQMDDLAILVSWPDGSSQVVPLSQSYGSVIQSGQSGTYVGKLTSATPPSSYAVQSFAWHVAGAPQCAGH